MNRDRRPEVEIRNTSLAARLTAWCTWLYFITVVVACGCLYVGGDRWWWGAPLLYGPRWLCLTPLVPLVPAVAGLARRQLLPLGMAGVVAAGPVCGFCLPWRGLLPGAGSGRDVRILTCNANAMSGEFEPFEKMLDISAPDVIVVQECSDEMFERLEAIGTWRLKRLRSLCVGSRWPIERVDWLADDGRLGYWGDYAVRCNMDAPGGPLCVVGVHLETPREGLEELLYHGWYARDAVDHEINRRKAISGKACALIAPDRGRAIVAGDFNLPVESAIYRGDWSQLANAFGEAGFGLGYTKRSRWLGIRIDHILAGREWRVRRCWIGPDVGSDHRPLIADLTAVGG